MVLQYKRLIILMMVGLFVASCNLMSDGSNEKTDTIAQDSSTQEEDKHGDQSSGDATNSSVVEDGEISSSENTMFCDMVCSDEIGEIEVLYPNGDLALTIKGFTIELFDFKGIINLGSDYQNDHSMNGLEFVSDDAKNGKFFFSTNDLFVSDEKQTLYISLYNHITDSYVTMKKIDIVFEKNNTGCMTCLRGESGYTVEIPDRHRSETITGDESSQTMLSSSESEDEEKSICLDFTYSTCPSTCQSQCVSSSCGPNPGPDMMCTADCDGAESCVEPSSPAILELEEKRSLWNNAVGNTNKRLTYTVFKGCNCLPETTGPFAVTAVGNVVLGAEHTDSHTGYYLDTETDGKPTNLKLGMNDLFDAIKEELIRIETSGNAGEVSEYKGITYDPNFGYPMSVNIGPIEVDGGLSFTVDSLVVTDEKDPAEVLIDKEAAYKEWVYDNGGNATYTFRRSCYCPPDYIGPFTVTLRDNEVTKVYYSGDEPIDVAIDPEDFEDYSIQNLFGSMSSSINQQPYFLSIEYYTEYPFPKVFSDGMSPMIADAGGSITISDVVIE